MSIYTARSVCDWLKGTVTHRHYEYVAPVRVTIGKHTFFGARYGQIETYSASERAVTEGQVKAGEEWTSHRFYLLGNKPKFKRANVCFTWQSNLPIDERTQVHTDEWYIACHSQPGQTVNEYHPFGPSMVICEWLGHSYGYYLGWKIDTGERFQYLRVPMIVEPAV